MTREEINKQSFREDIGAQLMNFRKIKGLSAYSVAKNGSIRIDQVSIVERGDSNYTIDIFLGYLRGCDLSISFSPNENQDSELNKYYKL